MAKWYICAKRADFHKIAEKHQIDPVVARIIRNKEIEEDDKIEAYLYPSLSHVHSPFLFKNMEKAVSIIKEKIKKRKKIRIIGDYDIDGVCASYILKKGLAFMNAEVDVTIPHRIKDGYGINEILIQNAYDDQIDTILTCDNGIAAIEQIAFAKNKGMTVIVTDHHEVPYEGCGNEKKYILVNADAIINPKQEDCEYPYSEICGGVVAYKLVEALLWDTVSAQKQLLLEELMEMAAFATVGDVMELREENRIIVKFGLAYMKKTKNIGLQALLEVNGLEGKKLTPYHIGFILGPCLNASGRLDSAQKAFALLEAKDKKEAALLAGDLKALNDSRKELTQKGVEEAVRIVEESGRKKDKILVLYLPDCHESLAGIIAGRIKERYGKPTLVLTNGEEGIIKGSGRSIEAYSMYEEMSRHKELFLKFGGHKMAAGLSMQEDKIELLRELLNQNCTLKDSDFEPKILIDVPMPISYITKEFIKQLDVLEPFGTGNQKPVFAQKDLFVLKESILGKNKNVAKFVLADEKNNRISAVYFGDIDAFHTYLIRKYGEEQLKALQIGSAQDIQLSFVYYPTINQFRGNEEIQLVIEDYQ